MELKIRVLQMSVACVCISEFPFGLVAHGPVELRLQVALENLFDRHVLHLAPADRDAWVHVVDSAGAERDRFVVLSGLQLDLLLLDVGLEFGDLGLAGLGRLRRTLLQ